MDNTEIDPLTPDQILMQVKTGKPFKYRDPDKHHRVITISYNGRATSNWEYLMTYNDSRAKDHLSSNMAKTLINKFAP